MTTNLIALAHAAQFTDARNVPVWRKYGPAPKASAGTPTKGVPRMK